ncbi:MULTISPECIES: erythromycin resistance leader peptide [unclassified Corynebacterium]
MLTSGTAFMRLRTNR